MRCQSVKILLSFCVLTCLFSSTNSIVHAQYDFPGIISPPAQQTLTAQANAGPKAVSTERPNIVLMMADDMGYSDIGCYGGEINTPNLNKLAANGLRLMQFYNTARCCPTRASLMSGLYPHQAGVGWMTRPTKYEGYQGQLNHNCLTIAEVLRLAGYSTYMSGKWHLSADGNMTKSNDSWPLQRGFDRFFGTITGAGSFYTPKTLTRDNTPIEAPEKGFYYTDAISDNAAKFIKEHQQTKKGRPFFLYVAFTSPHWPMHALEEDIAKYRGKYRKGWDALRKERHARMKKMGIVDSKWKLSERDSDSISWAKVPEKKKEEMDLKMAIYAAMIDRMDQGIGRILQALEQTGQMDNTLIIFIADNGGCAEGGLYGFERMAGGILGTNSSFASYGLGWANASNTPFRLFKHWVHAGGVLTPMIMHWPARIPQDRRGQKSIQPGHLIDIMATCMDVSAAKYPTTFKGKKIRPLEGLSLIPVIDGKKLKREAIYWEHEGNRAVRVGDWKLVAKGAKGPWELYNVIEDGTEMNNLAAKYPERVKELAAKWKAYAERAYVFPLNAWKSPKKAAKLNPLKLFNLKPGDALDDAKAPSVAKRAITIEATIGPKLGEGVIIAQGGSQQGYALYVKDQTLHLALRRNGNLTVVSSKKLPAEELKVAGSISGKGRLSLKINGKQVAKGKAPGLLPNQPIDGLMIGSDPAGNVGEYEAPFAYSGEIARVVIRLED